ncbi:hypothetical protein [uncultured Dokdonia sp.]|uniref:hypothetical protein n=1 Tax=uncultured Dokdonia sp. TaxID=575653 RepID=UPI00261907A5|nr:hypothetical protein [uncultured Dokdonia sp.]
MTTLLKEEFQEGIKEYEEGNHLTLVGTGFWISSDVRELTIGLEFNHKHYNFEYDSMEDAIDTFFYILTKRKKITNYSKGLRIFKTKVEIEIKDEKPIDFGTTFTLPLQFWKKTKTEITHQDAYIATEKVIEVWKELINYAQQTVK